MSALTAGQRAAIAELEQCRARVSEEFRTLPGFLWQCGVEPERAEEIKRGYIGVIAGYDAAIAGILRAAGQVTP